MSELINNLPQPDDYYAKYEHLFDELFSRIAQGESIRKICSDDHMISRATFLRLLEQSPLFEARCSRAWKMQAESMDDRILHIADKTESGELPPDAARVVLSALQWRASKLNPKKYGDNSIKQGDTNITQVNIQANSKQLVNSMLERLYKPEPEAHGVLIDANPVIQEMSLSKSDNQLDKDSFLDTPTGYGTTGEGVK